MINNNYNISLEKISNILTIKNNYYFKFYESIKIIENLLYLNGSDIFDNITYDSNIIQNNINDESISENIVNDPIKIGNNENEADIINNSSIDTSIYENNTYNNNNKLRSLENENITSKEKNIKEELKFKREYDRIKKILIENNYFIEIDKNMMP